MIEITISPAALAKLDGLGLKGQAAMVLALNQTAEQAKKELRDEMKRVFDRPTNYTLNSLYITKAKTGRLQAHVWMMDKSSSGHPASNYILPNIIGGPRRTKGVERALAASGHMPDGYKAVPGKGARLDAHGNMSRAQIGQIISQLRAQPGASARKTINAERKAGGRFFSLPLGRKAPPGIYQREFIGSNITPVVIFVRRATYKKTYPFEEKSQTVVDSTFPPSFSDAIGRSFAGAFS